MVIEERRPLRDLEADLHRISNTARSTFQELGTLLRDAESQHDAALTRQAEEYAKLKAIELEHWQFYEAFVQAASHGIFRATTGWPAAELNPAMAAALGYDSPADVLARERQPRRTDGHFRVGGRSCALARVSRASRSTRVGSTAIGSPVTAPVRPRDREPAGRRAMRRSRGREPDGAAPLETQLRRARRWEDVARVTTSGIAADLTHVVAAVSESQDFESMQRAASKAVA